MKKASKKYLRNKIHNHLNKVMEIKSVTRLKGNEISTTFRSLKTIDRQERNVLFYSLYRNGIGSLKKINDHSNYLRRYILIYEGDVDKEIVDQFFIERKSIIESDKGITKFGL